MDGPDAQATRAHAADAEDGEESTYIYIDLGDLSAEVMPSVGSTIRLQGLDTEVPQMVTSSGLRLNGEYEDSLGSLLFFQLQQQQRSASAAGAAGAAPAEQAPPGPNQEAGAGADSAPAAEAGSLPQQGGPASREERPVGQRDAGTGKTQPESQLGGASNQEQQAGSSARPMPRGHQEKGKQPRTSDSPAILASFLAHTDTVLRFRKAA